MNKSAQQGFTLIELMIVVAIIGILASIAIPAYSDYMVRAKVSEGVSLVGSAKTGVAEYHQTNGSFPTTLSEAGISSPTSDYVTGISLASSGGALTVDFNESNLGISNTLEMVLTPTAASGAYTWSCGYGNTTNSNIKYLPSNCRSSAS